MRNTPTSLAPEKIWRRVGFAALLATLAFPLSFLSGCSPAQEKGTDSQSVQIQRDSQSGEVKVSAALDLQSVQVAQPFEFCVTVWAPNGVKIQFPEGAKEIGPFEVVHQHDQFDVPAEDGRLWKRSYRLESLTSGEKTIPAMNLAFVDRRDDRATRGSVSTQPLAVEVTSLLEGQVDPRKFRDIKGEVQLASTDSDRPSWVPYGVSLGGAVLAVGLILLLWNRRQKNLTPSEWAIQQLIELQESNLLEEGHQQQFYCRVTDIIRQFIEARFGYRAPKQTTSEFLSAMQRDNLLCAEHRASLQEFLQVADMIKFACHRPSSADADDAVDRARGFVLETANESNDRSDATKEKVEV